jgi:hypothetical protein
MHPGTVMNTIDLDQYHCHTSAIKPLLKTELYKRTFIIVILHPVH